ncbi:MAG: hypothetical protein Q7J08_07180 [Methanocorpusculum sp.]|uniref:hypothetical protein n=1 Tax=Methanocorpusculum sp. TaxID=2058474 RepID=UPI002716EDD1|nr:hypothetical protein [Methanocorpusculum sp.]MDO9523476.1 hypothetical protein [Methanocorpusculum sp.]
MSEDEGVFRPSLDLEWTEWTAFQNARPRRSKLPKGGGFIRIRPIDTDLIISLTLANSALVNTFGVIIQYRQNEYVEAGPPLMKQNPAACLWTMRNAAGVEFEYSCSASSYEGYTKKAAAKLRRGHLAALLWEYRVKNGRSPLCNFIEMEPDLVLAGMRKNISSPVLRLEGEPADRDWMGLDWCEPFPVGEERFRYGDAGLIKVILDGEVTHISERQHLFGTLVPNALEWYGEGAMISVALRDPDMPRYQAAEMLSDLMGGYYAAKGVVPETQLRGMSGQHARKPAASRGYVTCLEEVRPRCEFGWEGY